MLENPTILPGHDEEIDMIREQAGLTDEEEDIIDEIKKQYDPEIKELVLGRE
jgi:hypothetical protein